MTSDATATAAVTRRERAAIHTGRGARSIVSLIDRISSLSTSGISIALRPTEPTVTTWTGVHKDRPPCRDGSGYQVCVYTPVWGRIRGAPAPRRYP